MIIYFGLLLIQIASPWVTSTKWASQAISDELNFRNGSEIEIDSLEEGGYDSDYDQITEDPFPLLLEDGLYGIGSSAEEIEGIVEFVGYSEANYQIDFWKENNESWGCNAEDYNSAVDYKGKIVLVYRGDCPFSKKAEVAARMGAIGISIVNLETNGNQIIKMDVTAIKGTMVAVSTMFKTAQKIWDNMELVRNCTDESDEICNPLFMHIGASNQGYGFEKIIVIIICLSFLVLLIISLIWVLFYYFQRFRLLHRQYAAQKKQKNAMKKAFSKMKVETLSSSSELVQNHEEVCCAVCIDNFESGAVVRHLTCSHVYHKKCIDPWLVEKGTCPQCKADILKALGLGEATQQSPTTEINETALTDPIEPGEADPDDGTRESLGDEPSVDHGSIDESDDGGISNLAFAPASSIHTENEVNSINIQVTQRTEDGNSRDHYLPNITNTPDDECSTDSIKTGFHQENDAKNKDGADLRDKNEVHSF